MKIEETISNTYCSVFFYVSARKLLRILLANCSPLSVMNPYLAIMRSLKAFFRDSAVALHSGELVYQYQQHLVAVLRTRQGSIFPAICI